MPASKERVGEVVDYALLHGDDETCEIFSIDLTTLDRYRRIYKKHFGENADLLLKIKQRYSPDELAVLADGKAPIRTFNKVISFDSEEIIFGFMTDTHIGSKYCNEDFVTAALNEFNKQGCQFFVHAGDVTEGMSGREGHVYELSHIGYKAQKDAAIRLLKNWNKPSYYIAGNHDFWFMKKSDMGADIVSDICEALPNASYIGMHEGNITINGTVVRLWHGEDSSSYSTSYRLQKLVESFTGGEKPNVLLCGHTHKQGYFFERNVHIVSGGSIQKQSSWMRYKKLAAHTGFHIIKMGIRDGSVIWFEPRWYPFYE